MKFDVLQKDFDTFKKGYEFEVDGSWYRVTGIGRGKMMATNFGQKNQKMDFVHSINCRAIKAPKEKK